MEEEGKYLSPLPPKNMNIHPYYGNKVNCAFGRSAQSRLQKKSTMQNIAVYLEELPNRCSSCKLLKAIWGLWIPLL